MNTKPTTIKEALQKFEEKEGKKSSECEVVKLCSMQPFIEKMDASISTLSNCSQLSLSTNLIEKIQNLNGLKHLKILSLGRNSIKSLAGLEAVGDTLEQLWISYNLIEKLRGINVLKKLQVLYMSHNLVKDESEFAKLADLPCLRELLFIGNPVLNKYKEESEWREFAGTKIKTLTKLDGVPLIRQEESSLDDD